MRRNLRLLLRFARVSLRDLSEFRIDFWTSLIHNLIYQAVFIVFWKSILSFTAGALGDWSFPELALLSAFTLVATAFQQGFVGFLKLSNKVVRGEMDKYLARPVSPLFALLAEEVDVLNGWRQLLSAGVLMAAICLYYGIRLSPGGFVLSLAILLVGSLVVVMIQGCLALLAFWWGDVSRIHRLFGISGEFERYPLNLFPVWLQRGLTWIIPIGLISSYPVLVLLGKSKDGLLYLGVGALLLVFWSLVFSTMWRRALVRYESFGG